MSLFRVALRRSLWLVLLVAIGGGIWAWRRDVSDDGQAPAEWPPLTPPAPTDATTPTARTTPASSNPSSPTASSTTSPTSSASTSNASFVNALVDAPEARSTNGQVGGWTNPLDDGSCPLTHPVKANDNSGIFHVPDGRFYERTNPERCYSDAAAATADGYRQAKH